MNFFNTLTLIFLSLILANCGDKIPDKKVFTLQINNPKKVYTNEDIIKFKVVSKKTVALDSVVYSISNPIEIGESKRITSQNSFKEEQLSLVNKKLGDRLLKATIYTAGKPVVISKTITLVASNKPKLYTYKILEKYPHDIQAYTQGLEFKQDTLLESTGLYKHSSLRKTNYKTGEVYKKITLDDAFFGEGITYLNNKIYQLTWREKIGFIYDANSLEKIGTFVYSKSKEGWGLCHNEKFIFKSDGTDKIWMLNPENLAEEDYIEIMTNKSKIKSVNELEWVGDKIYANIYQKDAIAIVDPKTGAVAGVINLKGLKDKVTQHQELDVLNGIAYKGEENIIYITGKKWDALFKIQIIEK
jgi:glutamine cyclotransferase